VDRGELELRAMCISVVSGNHRVCLKPPVGIGRVCIRVPFDLPDGTAVRACLSIRTSGSFPPACVLYAAVNESPGRASRKRLTARLCSAVCTSTMTLAGRENWRGPPQGAGTSAALLRASL
jgi:hypothetical protein